MNSVAAWFKTIGGYAFNFMLPLAGFGMVGVMMCAVNPIMAVINAGLNNDLTWLSDYNFGILLGCILGAPHRFFERFHIRC